MLSLSIARADLFLTRPDARVGADDSASIVSNVREMDGCLVSQLALIVVKASNECGATRQSYRATDKHFPYDHPPLTS